MYLDKFCLSNKSIPLLKAIVYVEPVLIKFVSIRYNLFTRIQSAEYVIRI